MQPHRETHRKTRLVDSSTSRKAATPLYPSRPRRPPGIRAALGRTVLWMDGCQSRRRTALTNRLNGWGQASASDESVGELSSFTPAASRNAPAIS